MAEAKRIARLILVIGALCTAAGPAFAWNHHWRGSDYWYHSGRDHWHQRRWHARGGGGSVHRRSEALPNPRLTPGATNPAVTQADIHSTICVRGYTRTIRPPERYTERLKRHQIRAYGYRDREIWHYEEDHLLCRVSDLLRTGATLGNSRRDPRRDTKSVAQTAGFRIRDNGCSA